MYITIFILVYSLRETNPTLENELTRETTREDDDNSGRHESNIPANVSHRKPSALLVASFSSAIHKHYAVFRTFLSVVIVNCVLDQYFAVQHQNLKGYHSCCEKYVQKDYSSADQAKICIVKQTVCDWTV